LYRYAGNRFTNIVDPMGLDWFRPDGEEYVVGREGSIVQPGGLVSVIISDFVPAGHTFGTNHDAFVGWAVNEAGIPDLFANVPSMPFVYVVSFVEEIFNSIFSLWSWLTE